MGGAFCFVIEGLYYLIFLKEENVFAKLKQSFAIIPGVLLAMVLPLNTPIWLLALGCLFGTVIGKMVFGGFGYNILNPALIGYIFIQTAYLTVINNNGGYLNATEVTAVTSATPLTNFFANNNFETTISQYGGLLNFFIGTIPGSMAETSSLLCLVALGYLLWRRVINWRIPVIYISTVFVITLFLGIKLGYGFDIRFPLFNIFSGGLMFGAVFMATEPVTSPRTPNGEIVFALFLGAITVMLRYLVKPEGVATSILFMNLMTPLIDNFCAKVRVKDNPKKMLLSYVYVGIGVLAIFGFTLMQIGG
jgi:electron transport complex protein RnfD